MTTTLWAPHRLSVARARASRPWVVMRRVRAKVYVDRGAWGRPKSYESEAAAKRAADALNRKLLNAEYQTMGIGHDRNQASILWSRVARD